LIVILTREILEEKRMCQVSAGKSVSQMNARCGCGCSCPAMLPVEEEIRNLEDHKKILLEQIEIINTKIAGLISVKEP
jgi:hypothetical protein